MQDKLMNLSFSFGIDLYRTKKRAENRGDVSALESLRFHYPELFTAEFLKFIEMTKMATKHVDEQHGTNFSAMFESEISADTRTLN